MLGTLIHIVLLAGLMYAFARHEAEISWPKLFLVFVPLFILFSILGQIYGAWASLGYVVCMIVGLKLWFYLDWRKASLIAIVHAVISFGIAVAFAMVSS